MKTAKIDVSYVAELARIELSDDERELFQSQLEKVVGYVEKIAELDLEGVEPTMTGCIVSNVLRPDEVRPSMDRETALENAPMRTETEFKLPKIVEGAES